MPCPIAVVENSFVLRPMNAREHAIQMFQIIVIVRDPLAGFRHSKFRIAPRHALDSHQPHVLAVQIKPVALGFEFPDPECNRELMSFLSACD